MNARLVMVDVGLGVMVNTRLMVLLDARQGVIVNT